MPPMFYIQNCRKYFHCLNDADIFFLFLRLNFQSRHILHMPRLPRTHPAALHPAFMFGPITVMSTATSKPVLVLLSPQSRPAVPERDRPGKQQQSASSSKTSLQTECIYFRFTCFELLMLLKSSIAESLPESLRYLLHIKGLQWG